MTTSTDAAVEIWETVDVYPLPDGWINVYRGEDGSELTSACPAIVRQELRETVEHFTAADSTPKMRTIRHAPPYMTRTVAADFTDGGLDACEELANYVGTGHRQDWTA